MRALRLSLLVCVAVLNASCKEGTTVDTVYVRVSGHGTVAVGAATITCDLDFDCPEEFVEKPAFAVTLTATPKDANFMLESLTLNSDDVASGTSVTLATGDIVEAVFVPAAAPLCTPTTSPASAPTLSFANPNGGGCVNLIMFLGGGNLGGAGTCVTSEGRSLQIVSGDDSVLQVMIPPDFPTGLHTFTVTTLTGTATFEVMIADAAAVPLSMSPNPVTAGGTLTITGTSLEFTSEVRFQGDAQPNTCTITSRSATTVVCTVPNNLGSKTVFLGSGCGGAVIPGGPLVVQ